MAWDVLAKECSSCNTGSRYRQANARLARTSQKLCVVVAIEWSSEYRVMRHSTAERTLAGKKVASLILVKKENAAKGTRIGPILHFRFVSDTLTWWS